MFDSGLPVTLAPLLLLLGACCSSAFNAGPKSLRYHQRASRYVQRPDGARLTLPTMWITSTGFAFSPLPMVDDAWSGSGWRDVRRSIAAPRATLHGGDRLGRRRLTARLGTAVHHRPQAS